MAKRKWWQVVLDPVGALIDVATQDHTIVGKLNDFISNTSNPILGGLNALQKDNQLKNNEKIINDYDSSNRQLADELKVSNDQLQKEKEQMLAAAAADAEADNAAAAAAAAQQQKVMTVMILVFAGVVIFLMFKKRKSG